MGTVTRDSVKGLMAFAFCIIVLTKTKRKHRRVPKQVFDYVYEYIQPYWRYLTTAQKEAFLFALYERDRMDTKYIGPIWKVILPKGLLYNPVNTLAANFI